VRYTRDNAVPVFEGQGQDAIVERMLARGYAEQVAEIDGVPVVSVSLEGMKTLVDLLTLVGVTYKVAFSPEERAFSSAAADLITKFKIALDAERKRNRATDA